MKNVGFLIICLVIVHYPFSNGYTQALHREIENIITHDTEISPDLTPGIIIGIIDGDSTYVESFGSSLNSDKQKLNNRDLFEIGSLTKLFTALLIDVAVEENKLNWDDHVNAFIPEEYINPRLTETTIKDLTNHQSGLPRRPPGFGRKELDPQNPYKYYTEKDLLEAYSITIPDEKRVI